jgi:hypothetical protein
MNMTDLSENDKTVLKWLCLRLQIVGNVLANRKNSHVDIELPRKKIDESFLNLGKLGYINFESNLIIASQKLRDYCQKGE